MDDIEIMKSLTTVGDSDFLYAKRFLEDAGFKLMRDGTKARMWCLEQANHGDTQAQYVAAELLNAGLFGSMDKNGALHWCKRAADSKFAPAMLLLASFHEAGWGGLSMNPGIALELMNDAAEMGYAPAMNAIALVYLTTGKSPANRETALAFLRRAAKLDYPNAQSTLATQLVENGTPAEIEEGLALLRRAAEQDFSHAHRMLGYFYKGGQHGLLKDEERARFHFHRAEEIDSKE